MRERGVTARGRARHATRLRAPARRAAIVDAALAVFAGSSYAAATTAAIARAAGVSEPILYRHFESKRALYIACLDQSWARLREVWEEAKDVAEPEGRIQAVSQATIALPDGGTVLPPTLWMQALAEAGRDDEIGDAVRRVVGEVHDAVEATLVQAQRHGAVHPDRDARAEAWLVVAGLLLRTLSTRVGGVVPDDDVDRIRAERLRWLTGAAW
jgi:AcrR family transcriptional regulator